MAGPKVTLLCSELYNVCLFVCLFACLFVCLLCRYCVSTEVTGYRKLSKLGGKFF